MDPSATLSSSLPDAPSEGPAPRSHTCCTYVLMPIALIEYLVVTLFRATTHNLIMLGQSAKHTLYEGGLSAGHTACVLGQASLDGAATTAQLATTLGHSTLRVGREGTESVWKTGQQGVAGGMAILHHIGPPLTLPLRRTGALLDSVGKAAGHTLYTQATALGPLLRVLAHMTNEMAQSLITLLALSACATLREAERVEQAGYGAAALLSEPAQHLIRSTVHLSVESGRSALTVARTEAVAFFALLPTLELFLETGASAAKDSLITSSLAIKNEVIALESGGVSAGRILYQPIHSILTALAHQTSASLFSAAHTAYHLAKAGGETLTLLGGRQVSVLFFAAGAQLESGLLAAKGSAVCYLRAIGPTLITLHWMGQNLLSGGRSVGKELVVSGVRTLPPHLHAARSVMALGGELAKLIGRAVIEETKDTSRAAYTTLTATVRSSVATLHFLATPAKIALAAAGTQVKSGAQATWQTGKQVGEAAITTVPITATLLKTLLDSGMHTVSVTAKAFGSTSLSYAKATQAIIMHLLPHTLLQAVGAQIKSVATSFYRTSKTIVLGGIQGLATTVTLLTPLLVASARMVTTTLSSLITQIGLFAGALQEDIPNMFNLIYLPLSIWMIKVSKKVQRAYRACQRQLVAVASAIRTRYAEVQRDLAERRRLMRERFAQVRRDVANQMTQLRAAWQARFTASAKP